MISWHATVVPTEFNYCPSPTKIALCFELFHDYQGLIIGTVSALEFDLRHRTFRMSRKSLSAGRKPTKTPKQTRAQQLTPRAQNHSPNANLRPEVSYDSDVDTVIEDGEDHDDDGDNAARLESYRTRGVGLTPQVVVSSNHFEPATVKAKPKTKGSMGPPSAIKGYPRKRQQGSINVFTDANEVPPTISNHEAPKARPRKRKRSPDRPAPEQQPEQAPQPPPSPPRPDAESLEDDSTFERDFAAVIKYRDAVVPQYRAAAAARAAQSLLARLPCRESDLRNRFAKGSTHRVAQVPTNPEFWQDLWLADLAAASGYDPVTTEICWILSRLRSRGRDFLLGSDGGGVGAQIPIPVLRPVVAPIVLRQTPNGSAAVYLDLTSPKIMQLHANKNLWVADRSGTVQQRTPWRVAPGLNEKLRLLDGNTPNGASSSKRLQWHTWHLLDPNQPAPHGPMTYHTRLLTQTLHASRIVRQRRHIQRVNAKYAAQWCVWAYELRRKVRGRLVEVHGINEQRGSVQGVDLLGLELGMRQGVVVGEKGVDVRVGSEVAELGKDGGDSDDDDDDNDGFGPMELTIFKRVLEPEVDDEEGKMAAEVVPKYERVGLGFGPERWPNVELKERLEREMNSERVKSRDRLRKERLIGLGPALDVQSEIAQQTEDQAIVIDEDSDDDADDDRDQPSNDSNDADDWEDTDEELTDHSAIEDEDEAERDTSVMDVDEESDHHQHTQDVSTVVRTSTRIRQQARRPSFDDDDVFMTPQGERVEQMERASSV